MGSPSGSKRVNTTTHYIYHHMNDSWKEINGPNMCSYANGASYSCALLNLNIVLITVLTPKENYICSMYYDINMPSLTMFDDIQVNRNDTKNSVMKQAKLLSSKNKDFVTLMVSFKKKGIPSIVYQVSPIDINFIGT